MKKTLGLITSFTLALSLLASCGSTGSSASSANSGIDDKNRFDSAFEITVISREEGSGTRGAFVELTGVEEKDAEGNKVDMTSEEAVTVSSTSVVMTTVTGDPYAIGYISMGSLNNTIKTLNINGIAPTAENVSKGEYPISRPFNLAVSDNINEAAQDFLDFILSAEGQAVVEENGYIHAVNNAQNYAGTKPSGKVVVAGSSSVTPVMEKLKEAYAALNPNVQVEVQLSDSSTGMASVISGVCDIGMASRELKDSEIKAGLTPIVMAMDGIAVITNTSNPLTDISIDTLKSIYTGEVLTWDDVD